MENVSESMKKILASKHLNDNFDKLVTAVKQDPEITDFVKEHQSELASDAVERSIAKLYEFYNVKQKNAHQEKTFAPGYLPHLVVNDRLIDIIYSASPEVQARQKELAQKRLITTVLMPKDVQDANLENFFSDDGNKSDVLDAAIDFIDEFNASPDTFHQGLYLYGHYGVGKTYLLGAIANKLSEWGVQTTLVHFPSLAVEMKAAISDNSVASKIDSIKKSSVLMIDDIGADSMSSWVRDDILGVILEYRMQQQLPTFFSSNFSMEKLEDEHLRVTQHGDNEPLKAGRLMERIRFLSRPVEMDGPNRRLH
ncbi:primosomal protein DnaI [Lentilactobacillus sp. SPB1-3]|uniref:Primosomal protein DnaI n=1 Tax=Lentilactobacillus terminaliae TaxID=3003483 RepID=A0ACD5DH47_9LACO|nr:primosomal protein DnaI [Lentilactobacillus sp. SPB1-3]MCZ0977083.1 primosomal protein DnaI [Lentilactobacillus sp. SPB1-3]